MKVKRVIALVLALTMMFALVAMTASAVTPRAACPACGSNQAYPSTSTFLQQHTEYVGGCQSYNFAHNHLHKQYESFILCRSCGKTSSSGTYWTTTCVF